MKRHFSLLVCALVAVAMMFSFASCDDLGLGTDPEPQHDHTYSGVWSNDATNHWHAATCQEDGCAEAKASVTAHSDADNNKICDVCAYDMGHNHAFSASWAMDADNHWHAASCGHNEIADKAAHNFDAAGLCTVCDYVSGSIDVAKAVQLGASFKTLVKDGVVYYTYASNSGSEFSSYAVNYEYGNDVLYIFDGQSEYEYWYSLDGENVFAVEEYISWDGNPAVSLIEGAEAKVLEGYNFSNVFNAYGEEEFYGVEALVSGLYALAAENFGGATTEYTVVVDGVTYYMFNFTVIEYNTEFDDDTYEYVETDDVKNLFEVTVMFTLTDNYSIDSVMVDTTKYAALDYDEEWNLVDSGVVVFEYDEVDNTKIVGYDIVKFSASASFSYAVEQTEGKRTLESKYTPETALISSFALEFEDGTPVSETINMVAGTPIYLYLGSIAPTTANVALDNVDVTCEDGAVTGFYSTYSEYIYVKASAAGTYEITVSTAKASVTFTAEVTVPATTEISASINGNEVEEYNCYSDATGGATVVFGAVANEYADAGFTAMLPPTVTDAALTQNEDGTYSFVSTTVGTWEILITSTANSEVTSVLAINVQTPPTAAELLNGKYKADMSDFWTTNTVVAVFTPASEGVAEGTVVIEYYFAGYDYAAGAEVEISVTETMTYAYADGVITVTSVSVEGAEESIGFTFAINDEYKVTVTGEQFYNMVMTPVVDNGLEGSGTDSDPYVLTAIGDYVCAFPGGYTPVLYSFTATATGTLTLSTTCATGYLLLGESLYDVNMNEGDGASLSLNVTEGTIYIIGVADWNEQAIDVPFSITIQ